MLWWLFSPAVFRQSTKKVDLEVAQRLPTLPLHTFMLWKTMAEGIFTLEFFRSSLDLMFERRTDYLFLEEPITLQEVLSLRGFNQRELSLLTQGVLLNPPLVPE